MNGTGNHTQNIEALDDRARPYLLPSSGNNNEIHNILNNAFVLGRKQNHIPCHWFKSKSKKFKDFACCNA